MNRTRRVSKAFRRVKGSSVTKYGFASALPRTVSIIGVFLLTPLALGQFGTVGFGYWTLATFVTGLVVSPDLGLGNGVVNEFTSLRARGISLATQAERIRGLVVLLGLVAATWLIIGIIISGVYAYWVVDHSFTQPTFLALIIGLFCFLSAVPISIVQKIQLAFEVANKAALWEGAGKVAAVILSVGVVLLVPNVYLLIVAYMLPVSLAAWINGYTFMRRNGISISRGKVSMRGAFTANREAMSLGRWFVVIQISYLFLSSADLYIVNAVMGPAAVSEVSVTKRPFDVFPVFVSMYAVALWPVFRRMIVGYEHRRLFRFFTLTSSFTVILAALGGLMVIITAPWFYGVLSAGTIKPQPIVLFAVAALVTMTGVVMIFTSFLNAAATIRVQAFIFVIGSLLSLGTKVAGLVLYGIEGFFLLSAASYFLFILLPLLILSAYTIRSYTKRSANREANFVEK